MRRNRLLRLGCEVLARVDESIRLEVVLLVVELPVSATERQQLGMRAALDDLPGLEHENLIRAADRREPMGDHERRAARPQTPQPVLDHLLALAVEARGRLVQDQDARVGQNRARDRHALPLPARQLDARARRRSCRSPAGTG